MIGVILMGIYSVSGESGETAYLSNTPSVFRSYAAFGRRRRGFRQ
jgi:hypothetical protein